MLNYIVLPFDRAFAFQVTHQSREVNNFLKSVGGSFTASNGWTITTDQKPDVDVERKLIYLRGTDTSANLWPSRIWDLISDRERDMYIAKVHQAINELLRSIKFMTLGMFIYGSPVEAASKPAETTTKNIFEINKITVTG